MQYLFAKWDSFKIPDTEGDKREKSLSEISRSRHLLDYLGPNIIESEF